MAISADEARAEILEDLGHALARVELLSASLGEAYELLAVGSADRLEAELFRPAQRALGRGKRALTQFAETAGIEQPPTEELGTGAASRSAKHFVEQAVLAASEADRLLADLQDSSLTLEFGGPDLRKGLSEVRVQLDTIPVAAREFLRTLGR